MSEGKQFQIGTTLTENEERWEVVYGLMNSTMA